MRLFIKHYFELIDFLNRVECQNENEEINSELNKLRIDCIVNAEYLKQFYTNDLSVHNFRTDLLKFIFKHAENIDNAIEMKEFIHIIKEKFDEDNF